jgi:hypothetical protein
LQEPITGALVLGWDRTRTWSVQLVSRGLAATAGPTIVTTSVLAVTTAKPASAAIRGLNRNFDMLFTSLETVAGSAFISAQRGRRRSVTHRSRSVLNWGWYRTVQL